MSDAIVKAIVNARTHCGRTPLFLASENGSLDIVRDLVRRGADVNAKNVDNCLSLHVASTPGVLQFLIDSGGDIESKDTHGNTTLHHACYKGKMDLVTVLLENAADVTVVNNQGRTPLHQASVDGNSDVVKRLLDRFDRVDARDNKGCTPLYLACINNHIEVVDLLIKKGADVNTTQNNTKFPLQETQSSEMKTLLLNNGGRIDMTDGMGNSITRGLQIWQCRRCQRFIKPWC